MLFFDETDDPVAIAGPSGTAIIQYFACKKLAEMTSKEKFQELRRKGFCFRSLFPAASQSTSKHSDGKCQGDFSCENTAHEKYPTKNHVLVCHDHRGNTENEQLFLKHNNRSTVKQMKLPAFSRDLKLTFHKNQQEPSDYKHLQSNQKSAIYIIKPIKVNNQNCSLFYDTSCCDMASRYAAVKSIVSRAKQESCIPISIIGAGNAQVKLNHDIFQVKIPLFNSSEATFSGVCLDQITVKFPQHSQKGIVEEDITA